MKRAYSVLFAMAAAIFLIFWLLSLKADGGIMLYAYVAGGILTFLGLLNFIGSRLNVTVTVSENFIYTIGSMLVVGFVLFAVGTASGFLTGAFKALVHRTPLDAWDLLSIAMLFGGFLCLATVSFLRGMVREKTRVRQTDRDEG